MAQTGLIATSCFGVCPNECKTRGSFFQDQRGAVHSSVAPKSAYCTYIYILQFVEHIFSTSRFCFSPLCQSTPRKLTTAEPRFSAGPESAPCWAGCAAEPGGSLVRDVLDRRTSLNRDGHHRHPFSGCAVILSHEWLFGHTRAVPDAVHPPYAGNPVAL